MAKIKILAAVVLLCVVSAVSYSIGCNKHYEAACHISDLIRCYEDHLTEDSLIEDYGCFEELEETFLHDDGIGNPVDLSKYSWCY